MKDVYKKVTTLASSKKFFYFVLLVLVFEGSWMALSSHYPMAFDEGYHFGLIKLYSHHISPWWNGQPLEADVFGAVSRDPSYIYHWLMSFLYRLINLVIHKEIYQVILLRLINVAIFAGGLMLMRQLLLKATKSHVVVNLSLLFFVLIPVIPSLAGQINYDNLLIGAGALVLLLTLSFVDTLRNKKQLDIKLLISLSILCLLSSLIKYAFLPIILTSIVFVLIHVCQVYRTRGRSIKRELKASYKRLTGATKIGLIVGFVISGGLFLERYGINTVKYHTPVPECNQVLNIERCHSYGPWRRNHNILKSRGQPNSGTVEFTTVTFAQHWIYILYRSMFYVLNGPDSGYIVGQQLILPAKVATLALLSGLCCLVAYWRQIFKRKPARVLLASVFVVYAVVLWLQNYADYLHLGQPVALQGRYLIPVLMPLIILLAISINFALKNNLRAKVIIASTALLLFLQGGGIVTFIARSDDRWYITNSLSSRINKAIQPAIKRATIDQ